MKTIKPFNTDDMRVKASERIHRMFKGAQFIYIKYKNTFAEGYCQYKDGVTAFFTVWYRDLITVPAESLEMSAHEKALEYVQSLPEKSWAS